MPRFRHTYMHTHTHTHTHTHIHTATAHTYTHTHTHTHTHTLPAPGHATLQAHTNKKVLKSPLYSDFYSKHTKAMTFSEYLYSPCARFLLPSEDTQCPGKGYMYASSVIPEFTASMRRWAARVHPRQEFSKVISVVSSCNIRTRGLTFEKFSPPL